MTPPDCPESLGPPPPSMLHCTGVEILSGWPRHLLLHFLLDPAHPTTNHRGVFTTANPENNWCSVFIWLTCIYLFYTVFIKIINKKILTQKKNTTILFLYLPDCDNNSESYYRCSKNTKCSDDIMYRISIVNVFYHWFCIFSGGVFCVWLWFGVLSIW